MTNETPTPDQARITPDPLAAYILETTGFHVHMAQQAILITEDKVRLCLSNCLEGMAAKRTWLAPGGILMTIVATLATTTFHDFYLDAATWRAIFIIVGILDLGWLIRTAFAAWKAPTIGDVVAEIKREAVSQVQG